MNLENWKHLTELKLISQKLKDDENKNNQVLVIDSEYKIRDDEDYDSEEMKELIKRKRIIGTRATAKRKAEKQKSKREDDDTIEDELEFTRLNAEFNNIADYIQTHEEFMFNIFGHRDDADIFNWKDFRKRQQSDNILALAIKLFKIEDKSQWDKSDIDLLKKWDKKLYKKLKYNLICIELNMLCVYDYDPILKKTVTKIVIPFNLRGKLMDYVHHNLLLHHFSYKLTLNKLIQHY